MGDLAGVWQAAVDASVVLEQDVDGQVVVADTGEVLGSIKQVQQWGSRRDPCAAVDCRRHGCKKIIPLARCPDQEALFQWFRDGLVPPRGAIGKDEHMHAWPEG